MTIYNLKLNPSANETILTVGFGDPATNDEIVSYVADELVAMKSSMGGKLLKVTGPASLPVAFVMCHAVAHLYGAVACFDPKLLGYVVCVSHDPKYKVGDVIV